jgi:hypothetical protein
VIAAIVTAFQITAAHLDHIRSDDPARSVRAIAGRREPRGGASQLWVHHDHGVMMPAMMTAMMSNHHHLGHQRLQDHHAGRSKK